VPNLPGSKCTCNHVAPCAGRSSGEDQSTPLSTRFFDIVVLECQNGAAGKGECGSRVDLETILNILRRDVEEWLPNVGGGTLKSATRIMYSGLGNFAWKTSQADAM
jgi:hypothetical protein